MVGALSAGDNFTQAYLVDVKPVLKPGATSLLWQPRTLRMRRIRPA